MDHSPKSLQYKSQPSHRKRLKTAENKGFLTFLNAMGRSVPLKTPIRFQIANKINCFVHVSYGTALNTNATEKRRCCTDSKRDTYIAQYRSEERRVGKECRSRRS